jgi:hypothetical protein
VSQFTNNATRSNISRAALFVNVSKRIRRGSIPFSNKYATRYVNVRVFPLPAPAITNAGPGAASTAANCSTFNSAA